MDGFRHTKMKTQLIAMYFTAVFLPILIIGIILITGNVNRLTSYHNDLLKSNNDRVKSILYEITNQVYNISEEIAYDPTVIDILSKEYSMGQQFKSGVDNYTAIGNYKLNYSGIEDIRIYTDQKGISDYKQFYKVTDDIAMQEWYKAATNQFSVYWTSMETTDEHKNNYWNLALARKITLNNTKSQAVVLIMISDNYLKSRIESSNYKILLSMLDNKVFYSSNVNDYGKSNLLNEIDTRDPYFSYLGDMAYYDTSYMSYISTLNMNHSDSRVYVTTISTNAYESIQQIVYVTLFIILLAMVLPAVIMGLFIANINGQVSVLRYEMNKASRENYDLRGQFNGCYELEAVYSDLQRMVVKIQDKDARMYQNQIAEQKLLNEQQRIEFQMLASQINPHFLYNTLEMIRMKAITLGDKETATAIKLLGKSMRYVLDNTGTEYTTLEKELSHIETYLQIQQLRFGDRVNYLLEIAPGIKVEKIKILPLLLQPIIENAILHGLEEVEEGGMIIVKVFTLNGHTLNIEISDNGCGMDQHTLEKMRENLIKGNIDKRYGIGLYNINQRIRMCYGQEYGVTIDSTVDIGTTVSATIKI